MRIKAFSTLALGVGLGLVGSQLAACSNSADDCNATASCGNAGSSTMAGSAGKAGGGAGNEGGGSGAGAGSNSGGSQGMSGSGGNAGEGGGSGSDCEGDVADDAACWTTNELGVFVSSDTGDDDAGNGTKEAPFASISKAIGAAAGKNVYVCLGMEDAYREKVMLSDVVGDGVKIYGGFECTNWTHDVARYVTVESPENIALRIQDLTQGVQIENVRFFAADGAGDNHSSYGAFVTNSVGVVLRRVEITAGDGLDGADGANGAVGTNGQEHGDMQDGSPALCESPGDGIPGKWEAAVCGSKGGNGGEGRVDDTDDGANGTPSANVEPANKINRGLGATDENNGGDGLSGANGLVGALGAAAAPIGSFLSSSLAYVPAAGNAGSDGFPGQGGGGGGASKGSQTCRGASGGAGGMGGCGGKAGQGGGGGGASIGLLSGNSDVTLEACTILSSSGGAGGKGGLGGDRGQGAGGGDGGLGVSNIAQGGDGGDGGNGGDGGSGSGGTGGPSYAIAYSGTKPVYTAPDTTVTAGSGGEKGIGGQVIDAKAPDGSEGDSQAEFEIP
jgi:hypothetical protein